MSLITSAQYSLSLVYLDKLMVSLITIDAVSGARAAPVVALYPGVVGGAAESSVSIPVDLGTAGSGSQTSNEQATVTGSAPAGPGPESTVKGTVAGQTGSVQIGAASAGPGISAEGAAVLKQALAAFKPSLQAYCLVVLGEALSTGFQSASDQKEPTEEDKKRRENEVLRLREGQQDTLRLHRERDKARIEKARLERDRERLEELIRQEGRKKESPKLGQELMAVKEKLAAASDSLEAADGELQRSIAHEKELEKEVSRLTPLVKSRALLLHTCIEALMRPRSNSSSARLSEADHEAIKRTVGDQLNKTAKEQIEKATGDAVKKMLEQRPNPGVVFDALRSVAEKAAERPSVVNNKAP